MPAEWSLGIHSQAFITSNIDRSARFITEDLGLRLVKRTVHPHDERIAVTHFGFAGECDQVVTYYEWHPDLLRVPGGGVRRPEDHIRRGG